MFGKNEIVGKSYFKDAKSDELFVTSMFYTLQGEGPYAGMPAFFIRLAKCNLNCSFCDTFFDAGDWLTFSDIHSKISKTILNHYGATGSPKWARMEPRRRMVLVMTGGEPMLQQNLGWFLEMAQHEFVSTQIESNGIIDQKLPDTTTLVVSPKCLEKNGKAIKYLKPNDKVLERADCLKFVISADPESPYYEIPAWALDLMERDRGIDIYVSPMNIYNDVPKNSKALRAADSTIDLATRSAVDEVVSFWEPGLLNMAENQKNHEYAAKYCMKHGLHMNLQMHLYASLA